MVLGIRRVVVFLFVLMAFLAFPNPSNSQVVLLNPFDVNEVKFSKLDIDARQMGSSIQTVQAYREYSLERKDAVVLFSSGGYEKETYRKAILRVSSFVENGGRALILVSVGTLDGESGEKPPSDFIADEFGVAISQREVDITGKIPKSVTEDFSFSGGDIGCSSYEYEGNYSRKSVGCELSPVHLVPINDSEVHKKKEIDVGDKNLNIYVEKRHGRGEVILMSSFSDSDGSPLNTFFNDNNYSLLDNEKVSKSMVKWLTK